MRSCFNRALDGDHSVARQPLVHELGEHLGYLPPPLLERLIEDAQKIHKQRPISQETLATATQPSCNLQVRISGRGTYFRRVKHRIGTVG